MMQIQKSDNLLVCDHYPAIIFDILGKCTISFWNLGQGSGAGLTDETWG